MIDRAAAPTTAPSALRFPPLLPRDQLEAIGYLKSFPHLAGTIFGFDGDRGPGERAVRARRAARGLERVPGDDRARPAAGRVLPGLPGDRRPRAAGRRAAARSMPGGAYVFRHEPSGDPARLQMFHQREIVRLGEPETVVDVARRVARPRGRAPARRSGSTPQFDVASDPFFGRPGRMLAASQREQALKFEVLVQIAGDEPTAVASFNYHHDHFAVDATASSSPTAAPPTRRASASASSASRSRSSHAHGLDVARVAGRGPHGARAPMSAATSGAGQPVRPRPGDVPAARLHAGERAYPETNCYADVSSSCCTPAATSRSRPWARTVRLDFEGDQWTFFKPRPEDLERSSASTSTRCSRTGRCRTQIAEQLGDGRTMTVELDAWFLPDTAATSYRTEHVKTTVIAEAIDLAGERLRYFHNAGALRARRRRLPRRLPARRRRSDDVLPPYTELVRFDAGPRLAATALRDGGAPAAREPPRASPRANPFERFGDPLADDLPGCWRATTPATTPTPSRRSGWPAPAFELCAVARRLAARRRRRRGVERDGRDRRGLQGRSASSSRGGGRSTRRAASRRWPRLGRGDGRAGRGRTADAMRPRVPVGAIGSMATTSIALDHGWQAAVDAARPEPRRWWPARVPGTAAGRRCATPASRSTATWTPRTGGSGPRSTPRRRPRARRSCCGSTASRRVAEVELNGERVLDERVDVRVARGRCRRPAARRRTSSSIRCLRARAAAREVARKPRARWRTRLVADGNGCAGSGRCCSAAPRASRRARRRRAVAPGLARAPARRSSIDELTVRTRPRRRRRRPARRGRVCGRSTRPCRSRSRSSSTVRPAGTPPQLDAARRARTGVASGGSLRVPSVARWWPHTHGEPALHDVRLRGRRRRRRPIDVDAGRVGFRTLAAGPPAPTTTSSATASTCTSTACRSSRAAPSGRRSTSSGSRRPRTSCARRSSASATPG